jgi:hypothetical protein
MPQPHSDGDDQGANAKKSRGPSSADILTRRAPRLAPVTRDEVVSGIRSGDRVYIGTGAAEPDRLVEVA